LICDFNEQQHNKYQHYRQQGLVSFIGVPLSTRGRTIGVLGLFNDHTQRHYSEDDQQLVGELSHQVALAIDNTQLHAATQRARAEAERAVQVRDQVFRLITHDLRAPLTSIQGYAHLLKRRISSSGIADVEQFIRGLESIEEATRRMAAHIQELLDTASLQAGHALSLRWGSVNFVALVEQVVEACQEMSHKHVIRLDARVSHLTGSGDDMRLERVFNNLITNAIKYSPEGGEISVTITRERREQQAWAVFSVQDQGIGIPADDLPLIFDSFHRAGNVGDAISGTGLGLASARQIVEQHGGKITVDSEEGVGTTFTVWLPIEASTADDESSA
jgi:signal transduction histidine kinase